MSNHITSTPTPATVELPESWKEDARQAAERAARAVRIQHEATMEAYAKQRASREPAYWLASHPCPSWCTNAALHRSGDAIADREHDSDTLSVSFDAMEPSVGYAEFAAPEMTVMLTQRFREVEPRVCVEMEGEPVAHATLDEAEQLAFALLDLVRQGRGQEPPRLQLFDSHGRCVTRECVTCHAEAEGASA